MTVPNDGICARCRLPLHPHGANVGVDGMPRHYNCADHDTADRAAVDPTEAGRRLLVPIINASTDAELADVAAVVSAETGEAPAEYDTAALQAAFEVESFAAPYVLVRRKSDGATGTLMFRHSPRVYFGFVPDGK